MLLLVACVLLCTGAMLEVSGVGFFGLDLLVGLCFGGSLLSGATAYLVGPAQRWSLLVASLATVALVFHVWLNS